MHLKSELIATTAFSSWTNPGQRTVLDLRRCGSLFLRILAPVHTGSGPQGPATHRRDVPVLVLRTFKRVPQRKPKLPVKEPWKPKPPGTTGVRAVKQSEPPVPCDPLTSGQSRLSGVTSSLEPSALHHGSAVCPAKGPPHFNEVGFSRCPAESTRVETRFSPLAHHPLNALRCEHPRHPGGRKFINQGFEKSRRIHKKQ